MALSFIISKCSPLTISLLPVAVTIISASGTASIIFFTSKPSIAACRAHIGSISATITLAPAPLKDSAEPLPTSPKPATTATFPAIITSVALRIPSTRDSLQPYLLSNLDFVTESLIFIAGVYKVPFLSLSNNLNTPVVVSSERPLIPSANSGYLSNTMLVKSPPSSRIIFSGLPPSKANNVCSIHQSNSSSFMPFQAYTGMLAAAIADAAWS